MFQAKQINSLVNFDQNTGMNAYGKFLPKEVN